ncbi:hypothetical protein FDP41_006895 [Naegleria fowleri]|uniref:Large ribosomal subunit protein uL4m n=1 Tax=Naegleria fowleri TaxID=5763 RepID=A0A6A5BKY4_NAEFO|nr:uncharacterized protein FDP41_006895 [Naegleria fowleri]KAF0974285.1 hypothetical protein FDP41_006895 [Naegleria fowleri]CAG4715658.1 unnamed protein product [Naegleria fowleri]
MLKRILPSSSSSSPKFLLKRLAVTGTISCNSNNNNIMVNGAMASVLFNNNNNNHSMKNFHISSFMTAAETTLSGNKQTKYHINTHVVTPNKHKFPLVNPEKINKMALAKALSANIATGTKKVMDASKSVIPSFEIQPEAMVKSLTTGEFTEMIKLHPYLFNCTPRKDILYLMVKWQLAKRRQGTHKTKHRFEVAFTKKKMSPQKGTGNARHGDRAAPQFRGGGHAMAIRPRSYAYHLNKKVRRLALRMALTTKYQQGKLIIVDDFSVDTYKTKYIAGLIKNTFFPDADSHPKELKDRGVLLIDGEEKNKNFEKGSFILHYADYISVNGLNVYDMLRREKLVLSKSALEALMKKYDKYIKAEYY